MMTDENIWKILENQELKNNIQKRPSMYIGAVGLTGLEGMVLSILDHFIQLSINRKETTIIIEMIGNQYSFSCHNKQGFYTDKPMEQQISSYSFLAIINALSSQFGFGVEKFGKRVIRIYQQSELKKKALIPSEEKRERIELAFTPNEKIFNKNRVSYFSLFNRCQQLAMLNSGLTIQLTDGKQQKNYLYYQEGLVEYIYQKDSSLTRVSHPLIFKTVSNEIEIQAVISKNSSTSVRDSFVNDHLPTDGGTHLEGFIQGAVDAMNQFLENTQRFKYLTNENFAERFDFVLSIRMKRPRYIGAVKKKVRNPELYKILKESTFEEVSKYLKYNRHWYSN